MEAHHRHIILVLVVLTVLCSILSTSAQGEVFVNSYTYKTPFVDEDLIFSQVFGEETSHRQLVLVVLTVLCIILPASAQVFVSIDCGSSSDSYQDENLIVWSGDGNYTTAGESRVVPSNSSVSHVMDTLRVFTNGRSRNCYHIDSVTQGRILLRVSFYYGNYDGRSSPPTFALHYDGNYWATVETNDSDDYIYYEVIYVMKRDSVSVCVSQTRPGEFPFISAIEVRGLETFMYRYFGSENPLFLLRRDAYGSNSTTRYGDDPYDRIWNPVAPHDGSGLIELSDNVTFGSLTDARDRPPPAVLRHAVTANTSNATIQLPTGFPDNEIFVFINWYFTEVARLGPNQTRSLDIILGNQLISNPPISPPYQNCTEWVAWGYNVTSNTTITLVPSNVSTLPPLINAMEVFQIGAALTNGTNSNDVRGLASLQNAFDVLNDWSGDPCLPAPYSWDWIECSNDTRPRVTSLLLGSFGLSGVLPDFSSMDALRTIDLHNNSLQGPIPSFLGTLPDLTSLNLANNQLNGSIPASLSGRTGLNLVVTGNPGLCTPGNSTCAATNSSQSPPGNAAGSFRMTSVRMVFDTAIASIIITWLTY